MTPTPWAQAVGAMRRAHWLTARARPEPSVPLADDQYDAMLRAALPHLLRAVVGELDERALNSMQWVDLRIPGDRYVGMVKVEYQPEKVRRALLAALTDAAGRVGG